MTDDTKRVETYNLDKKFYNTTKRVEKNNSDENNSKTKLTERNSEYFDRERKLISYIPKYLILICFTNYYAI